MVDVKGLKTLIKARGLSTEKLSEMIGMDDSTFYRKLNAEGKTFTIEQVDAMKNALSLDKETAEAIFFA